MRIIRDQRGTLAEYATMVALIAVMALPAVTYMGIQAADVYCRQGGEAEDAFSGSDDFDTHFSWAIGETECMCCIRPPMGWGVGGCPPSPEDC
ncbi:MAG: hypothetical protein QY326_08680 [Bdellovibrionota bacterium]|nr:MAG: hypothetical protein QY326_08680 [Bdellovibrionota bacterium]